MNQGTLRRWHRRLGICLAPFLLLQTVSGLVLTYGVFAQVDKSLADATPEPVRSAWNLLMLELHYGPGLIGWIYHTLIGLGLIWLIVSGAWIWIDLLGRKKQAKKQS